MKIAIIVPFYQRERGLLTKALTSVFAQDLPTGVVVQVYVVDDESPVPARSDIDVLQDENAARVTLLCQPNGGPGAARNLALDRVSEDGADYVAFLDSDDIWHPRHLFDAIEALEQGFDYYFCDHTQFNSDITHSSSIESLVKMRDETQDSRIVDPNGPVLAIESDIVKLAMINDYLSQTSTVVVRQSFVQTLRFQPELRGAGEDYLFWTALVYNEAKTVISWRVNVHCGRGINIYQSAFDFKSVQSTNRVGYMLLFRQKCLDLPLDDVSKRIVQSDVARFRRGYSYMFVRAWMVGQRPDMALFRHLWRRTPFMPLTMPFRFLSVLKNRKTEAQDW